jgi:hypothetical protein
MELTPHDTTGLCDSKLAAGVVVECLVDLFSMMMLHNDGKHNESPKQI